MTQEEQATTEEQDFSFELVQFLLSDCVIETQEALSAGPRKGWTLMFKAGVLVHAVLTEADESTVGMLMRLELQIAHERKAKKRVSHAMINLAEFKVNYMAYFKFAETDVIPKEKEFFEMFATRDGIQACHPYIQEHISNQTARMGFPPLMLGLGDLELSLVGQEVETS